MERKVAFQAKGAAWAKASASVVLRRGMRDRAERWAPHTVGCSEAVPETWDSILRTTGSAHVVLRDKHFILLISFSVLKY